MYMTREKFIQVYFFFLLFRLLFGNLGKKVVFFLKFLEKIIFFLKFCCQFQNLRLGVCLAKCLKFPEFEAGCAYELYAYKKKNV